MIFRGDRSTNGLPLANLALRPHPSNQIPTTTQAQVNSRSSQLVALQHHQHIGY
ncbi:hypothetical protein GXM_09643 [Nostoc sphaeroides CCNUC1]|uniref:Uncharacterized protein n=2 Tax=Nostoc sphaeroides TaxID=446679 RepID=A0A5P8WJX4_9NOSO|nr:hypothetical protein GXM_09643 [Nostoc sphaeroides CCNUC1]